MDISTPMFNPWLLLLVGLVLCALALMYAMIRELRKIHVLVNHNFQVQGQRNETLQAELSQAVASLQEAEHLLANRTALALASAPTASETSHGP